MDGDNHFPGKKNHQSEDTKKTEIKCSNIFCLLKDLKTIYNLEIIGYMLLSMTSNVWAQILW